MGNFCPTILGNFSPPLTGPPGAASGGAPVLSTRRRSRSARDRSSCTRRPRGRTTRKRTDGQTPGRSARHRRRGVDEPRLRQDTRPACVLPGTVWGAAPEQNCQVLFGAVLTLKSGRCPPACRGARCPGYLRSRRDTTDTASAPEHAARGRTYRRPAWASGATTPGQAPHLHSGEARRHTRR